ncbi:hypothetical protein ATCC90586_004596 [Pythium insidiosum]|nr:hypothetical protein ATCC90586_004596 [Pythium insidiosum]
MARRPVKRARASTTTAQTAESRRLRRAPSAAELAAVAPLAAHVLRNAALFRGIVSFLPGLPRRLLALRPPQAALRAKDAATTCADGDEDSGLAQTAALAERRLRASSTRGLSALPLVELAIHSDDQRALEMVFELRDQQPQRRRDPKLRVVRAMRVAAAVGRLAMLEWLVRQRPDERRLWLDDLLLLEFALRSRRLDVAQWAHAQYPADAAERPWLESRTVNALAAHNCLELLRWVLHTFPDETALTHDALDLAATNGHLEMVRYLHETRSEGGSVAAMDGAARHGHLHVVEFLHAHRDEGCTTAAMDQAAANGHLAVVRFLHEQRQEGCTTAAMNLAAKHGHLDVVRFLHERRDEGCTTSAMDDAASAGHLAVVQFLHAHRDEGCTVAAMNQAAIHGHLAVVEFLHRHRQEGATERAMDGAAAQGHADIVRFLHENRDDGCTEVAMDEAASHGHLEVVRFLHEHRREGCTASAMDGAAGHGHLAILEFLHENRSEGCTTLAMDEAAKNGHLHVLQFLRQRRREGASARAIDGATRNNHVAVVEFLIQHGDSQAISKALLSAAKTGNARLFAYLLTQARVQDGCDADIESIIDELTLMSIISEGHLGVIQLIHQLTPDAFDSNLIDEAVLSERLEVVKFLEKNTAAWFTQNALDSAAAIGNTEMLAYLLASPRCQNQCFYGLLQAAGMGHLDVLQLVLGSVDATPRGADDEHKPRDTAAREHEEQEQEQDDDDDAGEEEEEEEEIDRDEMPLLQAAVQNCQLEVVRWLLARNPTFRRQVEHPKNTSARSFDMTRYLHERVGVPLEPDVIERNLTMLRYKERRGCGYLSGPVALEAIAATGQLDLIRPLCERYGTACSADVVRAAIQSASLTAVRYVVGRSSGSLTVGDALDLAAAHGDIDLVRFLHERRVGGASTVLWDTAARRNHLTLLRYLQRVHRGAEAFTVDAMDAAAASGFLDVVRFLHASTEAGCTTKALDGAAANGHLAVVRFLHANRREGCTTAAMDDAAAAGHLAVVRFLHANRQEGATTRAMSEAILRSDLTMVRFLKENRSEGFKRVVLNYLMDEDPDAAFLMLQVADPSYLNKTKWSAAEDQVATESNW